MAGLKGGLGKGLDALFSENATDSNDLITVKLVDIEPNKNQPRKDFDEAALQDLADSISVHGLLQPIVVKPLTNGRYMIVAGERRWRACRLAGLDNVPVIIKDFDSKEVMEVALIENLQRENLNAVEESLGYKALIDEYGLTQDEVAARVGKSRSAVANALRLLNLTEQETELLRQNKITSGHARALLSAEGDIRAQMLDMALGGASVRDLEKAAKGKKKKADKSPSGTGKTLYRETEIALSAALCSKVKINSDGKGNGTLCIEFYSDEELIDLAKRLDKTN